MYVFIITSFYDRYQSSIALAHFRQGILSDEGTRMITSAVVGCGYWGPKLIRNIMASKRFALKNVCDLNPGRMENVLRLYPGVTATTKYEQILNDPEIEAVFIATPVATHFHLARVMMHAGKHVLIEKPLTLNVSQGEELVQISEQRQVNLMCDHIFCYTGAVQKIKELIDGGILGDLLYYDSVRVNLGLFQNDVNVIWDLAVHDIAIVDYLIPLQPMQVSAQAMAHTATGMENIAYVTLTYPNSFMAHFHVNWLSPVKIRKTLIGGSKKMIEWNDLVPDQSLKIYDKGISLTDDDKRNKDELLISYRSGDVLSPRLAQSEALASVVEEFALSIMENRPPMTDGHAALRVLKILDAADRSLKAKSINVALQW